MSKNLFFLILLMVAHFGFGQNCDKIKPDRKTGVKYYYTKIGANIMFSAKRFESGELYAHISVKQSFNNAKKPSVKDGLDLLFEDGSKLSFPYAKVTVGNRGGSSWLYESRFPIRETHIKVLSEKKITHFQLYVFKDGFQSQVTKYTSKQIYLYAWCFYHNEKAKPPAIPKIQD